MTHVGAELLWLRSRARLTLEEAARAAGVTPGRLAAVESGVEAITPASAVRLAGSLVEVIRARFEAAQPAPSLPPADLAAILFVLRENGPSTHNEIYAAYVQTTAHPRLAEDWVRWAVSHLHQAGYVTYDSIAGRGPHGRRARRWMLITPASPDPIDATA
ncbi:helix-turn-helix domain-containing protein [Microbacterium oleivorans]|uniref:Helix-turn-helix transcriptional regulator n=1 Tax=Microbacterium oleivorans TaxID=273677 RepID=A0A7D5EUX2_9MICO|nr:helix-turn-helix transcriptional regulator [Microbacterium oleivorans]QLD11372.1 helix-turn-helix transcriptional regulator [Microbacterium oleivorans]